jgi:hypothetical protein
MLSWGSVFVSVPNHPGETEFLDFRLSLNSWALADYGISNAREALEGE